MRGELQSIKRLNQEHYCQSVAEEIKMQALRFYIGWDSREDIAFQVARQSLERHASIPVEVIPIKVNELVDKGLYTRDIDPLASTEFTYSRFLTPSLAKFDGWAIFCDCDFLFFGDVQRLIAFQDPKYAVCCVKHDYSPKDSIKMDGQIQTNYPRKNWSSMMMFNCAHPSVKKLTVETVNSETGAYLHRMEWAKDSEIGPLPMEWNWLEGWNKKPKNGYPACVHYTRGGPWFKNWQNVDYADEWREEAEAYKASITS